MSQSAGSDPRIGAGESRSRDGDSMLDDTNPNQSTTEPHTTSDETEDDNTFWLNSWASKRRLSLEAPTNTQNLTLVDQGSMTANEESEVRVHPYIDDITYIEDFPYADDSKELMRQVSNEISPFLKEYGWTIQHFTEFYPENKRVMGSNWQQGRVIFLRLRNPHDKNSFRTFGAIMSTALHEICHNTLLEHDGDFYEFWNQLENQYGLADKYRRPRQAIPREPYPEEHIALATGGKKIFMSKANLDKHFSKLANVRPIFDIVPLGQRYDASIVIRLTQLAKGFDPAVERPLIRVRNREDFCLTGTQDFAIVDHYDTAHQDAKQATELYLQMYNYGEALGWHPSSKEWLIQRLAQRLAWDPRIQEAPYMEPELMTRDEVTLFFTETVEYIYHETRPEDKDLRRVVVERLREMMVTPTDGHDLFNYDMLNELVVRIPDLGKPLDNILD